MDNEWRLGIFDCAAGSPDGPVRLKLAGWIKKPFAITPRRLSDGGARGWHVTHLPTGWACLGVTSYLEDAQRLADELLALGDWNFVDAASGATALRPAVAAWKREQTELCSPGAFDAPLWLDHE